MSRATIGFATFSLENLALGLLLDEPRHGYQLYQDYQDLFASIWQVGRSKFYATLASLHRAGDLDAIIELQGDRPPRKIYRLTEAGRVRFFDWLYQPVTPMRAIRVEFMAKLRFFTAYHLPHPEKLLDAQIALCQTTLATWHESERKLPEIDLFTDLVRDFRHRQVGLILTWLHDCRDRLNLEESG